MSLKGFNCLPRYKEFDDEVTTLKQPDRKFLNGLISKLLFLFLTYLIA